MGNMLAQIKSYFQAKLNEQQKVINDLARKE